MENLPQRLARSQAADGMETRIETDAVPREGLEGAAQLIPLFQDGDIPTAAVQQLAAEQAAQAAADDERMLRHS